MLPGCAARPAGGQRRPGGVAQRHIQRLGHRPPSPRPRRDRRTRARSASRRTALPDRRAARRHRSRDGSGYFFTAWRCTNSRLQAWIGSSAWVSRASASVSASMPNSAATNPSRCGASATTSSLSSGAASASGAARAASSRACSAASSPARRSRKIRSSRTRPSRAGQVGEAEAEAQGHCVGGRHGIHHGISPSCAAGRAP